MRFEDQNIRLKINNLSFKAYLENSDIVYESKEQPLPFAPVSFVNDTMATRLNQKANFAFNVFSESRKECVENYNNLLKLIQGMKPQYKIIDEQYVPEKSNISGFVTLAFKGLPLNTDLVKLHVNQFSYEVNKDIGYIEIPKDQKGNLINDSYISNSGAKLIPIAYKIKIEGKILLDFEQTIRKIGGNFYTSQNIVFADVIKGIQDFSSTSEAYKKEIYNIIEKITGKPPNALPSDRLVLLISRAKEMKDRYLVDVTTGGFAEDDWGCGQNQCNNNPTTQQARRDLYEALHASMMIQGT